MSRDLLTRKRPNEDGRYLQELASQVALTASKLADERALSLPARSDYYELIAIEMLTRADACAP